MVKKACGIIAFRSQGTEVRKSSYRALVKPYLKYCVQFTLPQIQKGRGEFGEGAEEVAERCLNKGIKISWINLDCFLWCIEEYTIMRGRDRAVNQNLSPRMEMSKTIEYSFKVRGEKV